jgi:LAO/AO transport system kinase
LGDSHDSALRTVPWRSSLPAQPKLSPLSTRRRLSREQYVEGVLRGDRTILAQAITLVESSRAADASLAEDILEECLPSTGNSFRIGITGVPGAGKSSIIEVLGMLLVREYGQKVAVLAVDPSSQISGGSILADKTRMPKLASSPMAFVRPCPSRGSLGGVAQRTRETMLLCEAAGYQNIVVETVGVGQSETAVHDMVDFFLLILLAGAGDELQGMKRGVMELADLVAVNKADVNPAASGLARREAENALHYFPLPSSGWTPRAVMCSALTGKGIPELWKCVLDHRALTTGNGSFTELRREQARKWMNDIIQQGLAQHFQSHPTIRRRLAEAEQDVLAGRITPFRAARKLLQGYTNL